MFLCDPLELCVAWYQALVDPTKSTELREFVQEVVHSEIALRNEEIIRRLRQEQMETIARHAAEITALHAAHASEIQALHRECTEKLRGLVIWNQHRSFSLNTSSKICLKDSST